MDDDNYPSVSNPDGSESEHVGASTSVAASGYASSREARDWARDDSKLSNRSLGNIQVRMRGLEQTVSTIMKPYKQSDRTAP